MAQRQRGFTLIEVMISLMVLAIIATMGVMGLQAIVTTDHRQREITDQLAELQFAYLLIQRDMAQVILRSITDTADQRRPAFLGTQGTRQTIPFDVNLPGHLLMEFTRDGVQNPQQLHDRSTLQRVSYFYDGETIRRYAWFTLDRVNNSAYLERDLLTNIKNLEITYFDRYAQRFNQWSTKVIKPPDWMRNMQTMDVLPAAMEWRFTHPRYGVIVWNFIMPGADYVEPPHQK